MKDIYLIVKHSILDMFTVVGKAFTLGDMISFLSYDMLDFNDRQYNPFAKNITMSYSQTIKIFKHLKLIF